MSAAIKYYHTHKEQVLKYKKEFYINKTYKYSFFNNVIIKGFSKRETKNLIKKIIDKNIVKIYLNEKVINFQTFINMYKIKDYNRLEIDAYLTQYLPEEDMHYYCEAVEDAGDNLKYLDLKGQSVDLYFYDNQLIEIN
jgi:hypothetical protein